LAVGLYVNVQAPLNGVMLATTVPALLPGTGVIAATRPGTIGGRRWLHLQIGLVLT